MEGGGSGQNWAALVAGLAGEGVGKDEGHTMAWFVLTDGVGRLAAVSGGTCRWSFGSGGGGRRQCVQRHMVVVWGRVKLLGRLVGGGRAGISDLAVVHRGRAARQPAHGQQATFISGQLSSLPSRRRGRARLNSPVRRRPWQARLVGNRATDSWAARDGRTARHALLGDGPRS
jgi:hypothetical protein